MNALRGQELTINYDIYKQIYLIVANAAAIYELNN